MARQVTDLLFGANLLARPADHECRRNGEGDQEQHRPYGTGSQGHGAALPEREREERGAPSAPVEPPPSDVGAPSAPGEDPDAAPSASAEH